MQTKKNAAELLPHERPNIRIRKSIALENTKLSFRVATRIVKTTASSLTNKHGIIPDQYVIPNIDNFLNNTDTVLNFTLKLIEKE